jgi:drug/metabolite transporter (DMT)-like permease
VFFIILAILSALLFGAAKPISKALLSILTPFQLAGLCISGPRAGLLPVLVAQRSLRPIWRLDRANRIRLLGAVIIGGICGPLALLFGLRMAAAASVAMWLNLELVATALLGHFSFAIILAVMAGWPAPARWRHPRYCRGMAGWRVSARAAW